jgi:SAM-dependent methyltransferase
VGAALDRCFLESPVCATLRSRRSLLAAEIGRTLDEAADGEARVACFGCGPAAEVFDAVQAHPGSEGRLRATLVDFDPQALEFVAGRRDRAGLQDALRTVEDDVVSLAAGRTAAEVADQDLVYGAALLDAADDALAVRLLDRMHAMLRPGGRAVLCTFLPANPSRAYMDHVLEWRVMHRDQGAVDRLFAASAFGRGATAARADAQGLALVAECVRAA